MRNTLSFVVNEAIKYGELNHLTPQNTRNMIKYVFTNKTLAPENIDSEYVSQHLPFILTLFDRTTETHEISKT